MLRLEVAVTLVLRDEQSGDELLETFRWAGDDAQGTIAGAINKACYDAGLVSSTVVPV